MAASSTSSPPPSAGFNAVFRAEADKNGRMSYAKFMELALYHPALGYYRRSRPRVGYGPGTDFYTSTTSGPVFGELIATACGELLRAAGRSPGEHTFVEIGAEPGGEGVLTGVAHPFRATQALRLGDPVSFPGQSVVFSNELFDAQPCVRTICRRGQWVELGVELRDDTLVEVELDSAPPYSPGHTAEGYRFDQPLAAAELARQIATQPWQGLFVAFDYGKTLRELVEETPAGTARAYLRHTQSNNLLANPGEQDLTCHVCWDWLTDALRQHGFQEPVLR